MIIKKTVVGVEDLEKPLFFALGYASALYSTIGQTELVVTSAKDSHENRPNSLHHNGLAVDIRISNVTKFQTKVILDSLQKRLDPLGFDTALEKDHIHIEYQPKEGEILIKREAGN